MKETHPLLRLMFYVGSFLSLIAGFQLFVLYKSTDVNFAWTIQSNLTAVTLGAFYWATMVVGILSAREKVWVTARAAVRWGCSFNPRSP